MVQHVTSCLSITASGVKVTLKIDAPVAKSYAQAVKVRRDLLPLAPPRLTRVAAQETCTLVKATSAPVQAKLETKAVVCQTRIAPLVTEIPEPRRADPHRTGETRRGKSPVRTFAPNGRIGMLPIEGVEGKMAPKGRFDLLPIEEVEKKKKRSTEGLAKSKAAVAKEDKHTKLAAVGAALATLLALAGLNMIATAAPHASAPRASAPRADLQRPPRCGRYTSHFTRRPVPPLGHLPTTLRASTPLTSHSID